jgi:phospholipase A-2-activating protein
VFRAVRTFTRNGKRIADEEEIQSLKNESELAAASGAELDDKTILSFPTIDKMASTIGKKEGEVRIFREGMRAKAYAWQGGKWVLMGDVQGQQHPKKTYEGDKYFPAGQYDYVFDVQDESGINRRLPFNDGDNPLVSAEKFLVREGMNMGYKEQIIKFIINNSRSKGKIGKPTPA